MSVKGEPLCDTLLYTTCTGPELLSVHLPAGSSHCLKARAFRRSCLAPGRLAQAPLCSQHQAQSEV